MWLYVYNTTWNHSTNLMNLYNQSISNFHSCKTVLTCVHKLIIVTVLYFCCLTCLQLLTLSTTISYLKDFTLGSQFTVLLLVMVVPYKLHTIYLNRWKKSQSRELKCGMPQGSVLKPILYLLYTAPLADVLRYYKIQLHFFADTQ